jgi:hypothetical protein
MGIFADQESCIERRATSTRILVGRIKIAVGLEERAALTGAQDDYIRPAHPTCNFFQHEFGWAAPGQNPCRSHVLRRCRIIPQYSS